MAHVQYFSGVVQDRCYVNYLMEMLSQKKPESAGMSTHVLDISEGHLRNKKSKITPEG